MKAFHEYNFVRFISDFGLVLTNPMVRQICSYSRTDPTSTFALYVTISMTSVRIWIMIRCPAFNSGNSPVTQTKQLSKWKHQVFWGVFLSLSGKKKPKPNPHLWSRFTLNSSGLSSGLSTRRRGNYYLINIFTARVQVMILPQTDLANN